MSTVVALGDLLELSDSGVWGDEDEISGVSVLRSTNFNSDGTLNLSNLTFRVIEERNRERKLLRPGDILLEKSGGGPKQPVGRVCLFKGDVRLHSFGNFIARLRPKEDVLSEYLFYFLWHYHATGRTSQFQKQTTGIRNLEFKRYLTTNVPIVSQEHQRRIVDLLSRAEGIVRLRREAQKKAAEIIPALFLDMFGDPATNPRAWPVVELGSLLAEPPVLGTMAKPSSAEGKWLDLRVANIQDGELTLADKKWVDLADEQVSRFELRKDDLLLARAIGSLDHLGKAIIVEPTGNWTFDSHLMRLRLDQRKLLAITFKAFLESPGGRYAFLTHTRRSAVQFNINGKELRRIQIPLPPIAVQNAFANRALSLRSLRKQQQIATQRAESIFSALLARVFTEQTSVGAKSGKEVAAA